MTWAWYGHLRYQGQEYQGFRTWVGLIIISWGIAFFEYCLQVPANRIGFQGTGGPLSLVQLKIIQEVITLLVFVGFTVIFFRKEQFTLNHLTSFACLVMAVYFAFKK